MARLPKEWVFTYLNKKMYKDDPVIIRSSNVSEPFSWDEAFHKCHLPPIFTLAKKHGIEQGFSVPIHEPGSAFGSMHFATTESNLSFKKEILKNKHKLSYLSYLAHHYRPAEARQINGQNLTERELECLRWIAMGKTYSEIALILCIKERTVKYHARNIKNKMNSINMKQAMIKALQMNFI